MTKPNGAILYRGPSLIDGKPIVVVATGLANASQNEKTGNLIQTWILLDFMAPHHAVKTGDDVSVCGDCVHRPVNGGSCYVKTFQAPLSVYNGVARGIYPYANDKVALAALGAGKALRLGSYGDPAAVPLWVWEAFTSQAIKWTGYTHQWRKSDSALSSYCMASVDSEDEASEAQSMGWRCFRVRASSEPVMAKEVVCPASKEAGYKTDCITCGACMGTSGKAKASIVIMAHGATARRFELTRNGQAIAAQAVAA